MAKRHSPFGMRYYEDPTVSQVAALEYERLWGRIGTKVQHGGWFYRAREEVLAEEMRDIQRAYGKPVADRVAKAIQHTAPAAMPKAVKDGAKDAMRRHCTQFLLERDGRITLLNRLSLKWWGVPWW